MVTIQSIQDSVRDLAPYFGIKNAMLFGSYAKGSANSQSDVDLLLEFETPGDSLLQIDQTVKLYDA